MEPVGIEIRYEVAGQLRTVRHRFAAFANGDIALAVQRNGEAIQVSLAACGSLPVRIEVCEVQMEHSFPHNCRVLVNGYQSWTDTTELPPNARMRSVHKLLQPVVNRWVLDASGDTRFTEYSNEPGQLHGFTYATVRTGSEVVLLASLDESQGFTFLRTNTAAGTVLLSREAPLLPVEPGTSVQLCSFCIVQGTEDAVYNRWMELANIQVRLARPLCGYSSWYSHYENISEEAICNDLASASAVFSVLRTHQLERVFQIDDGWCKKGDWACIDAEKFPHGLAPLASQIVREGFIPGLWIAPFIVEQNTNLFLEHPNWLLRNSSGQPIAAGSHWSGHFALDTQNPEVRTFVQESISRAVCEWGFQFLKLDFLYAACMVPHAGLNRGQLMADAMQLVREAVGPNTLILTCGVPLASAFGVADYCRVGCDVGLDWDSLPHMRLLHRERISTKNSLANTVYRGPLNGRAFANDPDVVFLRNNTKLTPGQREQLLRVNALFGGMLLTSDNMGTWGSEEIAAYQEALDVLSARYAHSSELLGFKGETR